MKNILRHLPAEARQILLPHLNEDEFESLLQLSEQEILQKIEEAMK